MTNAKNDQDIQVFEIPRPTESDPYVIDVQKSFVNADGSLPVSSGRKTLHRAPSSSGIPRTLIIGGNHPVLFPILAAQNAHTSDPHSADIERFLERYKTILGRDFKFSSEPDYKGATANIATGREESFSRGGDQARFEAIGALLADDAAKITASCVKPIESPLTPEEKQKRLSEAAYAATHACAFMDYKK